MMLQSAPGGGSGEAGGLQRTCNNTATMTAYYNDLKLFFQKAGAFPGKKVVLHVEPDLWGYMEQRSDERRRQDRARESGGNRDSGIGGSAEQRVGLCARRPQASGHVCTQRERRLSHQRLGNRYRHRLVQPARRGPWMRLPRERPTFYQSLAADFDVAFAEFSDRDAAFKQFVYGDGGQSWFDAEDFRRSARFLGGFSAGTGKRIVMWQIPLGNTKIRAQNNTTGHYQDNRPEWLLDDPSRSHLAAFRDAGVVAFLFGGGAGGTTCACNAQNDGVTNPAPINGNNLASEAAAPGPRLRSR